MPVVPMPKKSPGNRAAIFARYSSSLQSDLSLEAQVTEIEKFCHREGLEIVQRYLLPETRSAHVEQAPEFQSMIRAAKAGTFDILVIHKLDRFTRSRDVAVTYKAILKRHGVRVRSVSENLGESLHDRLIEGVLEVIAEFYSLNLGEETKKGQRAAVRRGRWKGGTVPFGYTRTALEGGGATFESDPQTGPILKEVFRMYSEGHQVEDVLAYTQEATGKRWQYTTLQQRLKNPTYIGRLEYGKTSLDAQGRRTKHDPKEITTGTCPALVDPETWQRTQARMATGKKRRESTQRYPYLLTEGTLSCACCGRPVVGACNGRDGVPYYLCSGWRDKLCPSKHRSTRADLLDAAFVEQLYENVLPRLDVADCYRAALAMEEGSRDEARAQEREIQQSLAEVATRKNALLEFIMTGAAVGQSASITQKLRELEVEEGHLAERLATTRMRAEEQSAVVKEAVANWFSSLVDTLRAGNRTPEWKRAIRSLFRISWDWETKSGSIYLVPLFSGEKEEARLLGEPLLVRSRNPEEPSCTDGELSECPDTRLSFQKPVARLLLAG